MSCRSLHVVHKEGPSRRQPSCPFDNPRLVPTATIAHRFDMPSHPLLHIFYRRFVHQWVTDLLRGRTKDLFAARRDQIVRRRSSDLDALDTNR